MAEHVEPGEPGRRWASVALACALSLGGCGFMLSTPADDEPMPRPDGGRADVNAADGAFDVARDAPLDAEERDARPEDDAGDREDDAGEPEDASAGTDTGTDAGTDAGADAGTDAGCGAGCGPVWTGECVFPDVCAEVGARLVVTPTCTAGGCMDFETVDTCHRHTDGIECGRPDCGTCLSMTGGCDGMQSCVTYACGGGACQSRTQARSCPVEPCVRVCRGDVECAGACPPCLPEHRCGCELDVCTCVPDPTVE